MSNYKYTETIMPMTGDPLWNVDDISLALGGVEELMQKFIEKHKHSDFSLSIFDSMTNQTIEIDCGLDEMPTIVDYIYHLEKGTPLTFIGVNSISDSYVVGMTISRGRIDFGCYKAENGKLVKL